MTSRHLKTLSCSLFAGALESMVRIEIRSSQLRAIILTRGATLAELHASDRSGRCGDVLLGFSTEEGWACAANPCMGCIIGRVAGRTCPDLTVDAVEYKLPGCDGGGGGIRPSTNLHGGLRLSRQEWRVTENSADAVVLQAICIGRDCGFPGMP
jgi:aldose 1-epimerase